MTRTFTNEIENDLLNVKKSMNKYYESRGFELGKLDKLIESFTESHKFFYCFSVLKNEVNYKNEKTSVAIKDFIEGFYDYFWLMVNARYKAATISFRSALEMLIKAFLREVSPEHEKNSFSNNIEKLMKDFKDRKDFKKKDKKFINKEYTEIIKEIYGDLSNITHGNYDSDIDSFNDYLIEIIDIDLKFNNKEMQDITNEVQKTLEIIVELFLILNYEEIIKNMNNYKLGIITSYLRSERFKTMKQILINQNQ